MSTPAKKIKCSQCGDRTHFRKIIDSETAEYQCLGCGETNETVDLSSD